MFLLLFTSAEKLTEDPNSSVLSMHSESGSESLAPKVLNITEFFCHHSPEGALIHSCLPFASLQVKTEDVDLQSVAPASVNLIDFTDLTPVVSLEICCDRYP